MIRQRDGSDNSIQKPDVYVIDYYWNRCRIHWITLYILIKKHVIYHIRNVSFNINDEYDSMPIDKQSDLDECLSIYGGEFKDKLNIIFHIEGI